MRAGRPSAGRAERIERIVTDREPSTQAAAGGDVLAALEGVIAARRGDSPDRSYTSRLLAGGVGMAGAKVVEEADELARAAAGEGDERVVAEAADLVYHALVLLACRGLSLSAVTAELARRFGTSGLVEKASRGATGERRST
jgi:phosphoribosyl-ATP pyrophosphohydrolase